MVIGNSFLINSFMETIWVIQPERLEVLSDILANKFLNNDNISESLKLVQDVADSEPKPERIQKIGNIGILNIEGTLVPKASWLDTFCGLVSVNELSSEFDTLMADPYIKRIILYFDSPGGSVQGIPEFAAKIFDSREEKEIVAFTDSLMCSGAYYLASAASKIAVTPSSIIGSIGVYNAIYKLKPDSTHYETHYIQAGKNKVMGNETTPLTESEVQYFQEKVNSIYELFTADVAKGRGTSVESVKATEASYYSSGIDKTPEWMFDTLADANNILMWEV